MLEAEIVKGRRHRTAPVEPHPDQVATAERLHDALLKSTGREVDARPHRLGFQVVMDQEAVERLTALLVPRPASGGGMA
jgi:hypothetical protein